MGRPVHLEPFVSPVDPVVPERRGAVDLYLPAAGGGPDATRPVVVFVHGGPLPPSLMPKPRDWPVYQGYGSLLASRGAVAAVVEHDLHGVDSYERSAVQVRAAIDLVRGDARVDGDRVALWFFSGGGPLGAQWLRDPPEWLRCVALSYPLLDALPGFPLGPGFRPVEAVRAVGDAAAAGVAGAMRANALPIVLTRVGLERPELAATVEAFTAEAGVAGAELTIVDVPNGRHAFDVLDHTDESRQAVTAAVDRVLATFGDAR